MSQSSFEFLSVHVVTPSRAQFARRVKWFVIMKHANKLILDHQQFTNYEGAQYLRKTCAYPPPESSLCTLPKMQTFLLFAIPPAGYLA
jgi:hypothetical protein